MKHWVKWRTVLVFLGLAILGLGSWATADVDSVSVSLGNSTVNTNSSYTISFNTGSSGALSKNSNDTIVITFPDNTIVPSTIIAGSQIKVNNTNITTNASGSGQTLTITTPVNVNDSSSVTVVINTGTSNLRNPSIPGTYSVQLHTSTEANDVSSSGYNINASSTALNVGSLTLGTNTIGNSTTASFTIFLGSAGALWGQHSQIVITFPSDTLVQNGTISSTVSVSGTSAYSAVGNSSLRTITIVPDQNINNSGIATISLPKVAIRNPTTTGSSYTLAISTSAQSAGTSSTYTITTSAFPVGIGGVTPSPSVIGQASQYTIDFSTGNSGALVGAVSTITIAFDSTYTITNGNLSGVTVEGVAATSATGSSSGHSITVVPAQDIAASTSNVTVVLPSTAIINSYTTNNYILDVSTSVQPNAATSAPFSLSKSSTAVNIDSVTLGNNVIGNTSSYNIQIDLASDGALYGNAAIIVTFPVNTTIPDGALSGVRVEGVLATSATGDSSNRKITINPGQNPLSGTNRNIVIPSGLIRNPTTTSTTYQLQVETDIQPGANSPNYAITTSVTPITVTSVVPNPATITKPAQYTINFNTASDGALAGKISGIFITFPSGTTVKNGDLSGDGITVEGVAAYTASGNSTSRIVTIVPNQDINASTNNVTVVIPNTPSTVITNPSLATDYALNVATSPQPNAGTSPNYTIGKSSTPVNIDSVTVSPATIGNQAQYTIQMDLSSDGGLSGSDTITLTFPNNTEVLTDGAISGVKVNGTAVTSAIGSTAADTIVIDPSQPLANGTNNIQIVIPSSAVRNPTTINSYNLKVETSLQPEGTSPNYAIGQSSTQLSVGNVSVSPNVVGNQGAYTIQFTTSDDGALIGNTSTLVVTFPATSKVASGSISGVMVDGVSDASSTGDGVNTITIVIGTDIAKNTSSTIYIPAAAVRNPTSTGTGYTLNVRSSVQPAGTSNTFTIEQSSTALSVGNVSLSRTTIGNLANVTIAVTTSSDGALVGGSGTFVVTFPSDTAVPNGAIANVTVDGTAAASANGNSSARTVTIVPQQGIAVSHSLNIVIGGNQITNPTTSNSYQLQVSSTAQPLGTSNSYSIGTSSTQLDLNNVLVSPNTIGNQGQYTIAITLASDGRLIGGSSTITLTFPNDSSITNGTLAGVKVDGTDAASATGNHATSTITITPQQTIAQGSSITVSIPATAVRNPTTIGSSYTISGHTNVQLIDGDSNSYSIGQSPTQVVVTSVTPTPNTVGNPATYAIGFSTSSDGALLNGISTITVTFPSGTSVKDFSNASAVQINGSNASAVGSSSARTVTITVNQAIAASTAVALSISSSAITNPTTQNNYQLYVATSVQPQGSSPQYYIGTSSNPVTINSVTPSPSTVGNNAAYTISITTSSDGALVAGTSNIIITFPADTLVPDGALPGIMLNGINGDNPTGSSLGRTITIVTHTDIAGNSTVAIAIPLSVGLRNPTTTGNKTLAVGTSAQPAGSKSFTIGQSSTTLSVNSVTPSPATVGSDAGYNITFSTSSDGVLIGGTSQIVITFPVDTVVTNGTLGGITVASQAAFSALGSGRTITIVPQQDIAGNPSNIITVDIPSGIVENPTNAGNYSLSVGTTPQPAGNKSYDIFTSSTAINVDSVSVSDPRINFPSGYSVPISTDTVIRSQRGSFFIIFPNNTLISSGAISSVTIGGAAAFSATGNQTSRTVTIVPNSDVDPSPSINISIPATAITNASIPTVPLYLGVSTTAQPEGTGSFTLIPSTTSMGTPFPVTPTPSQAGLVAEYKMTLTTGSNGRMGPGNKVTVVFPAGTIIPASMASGTITVDGVGTTGTTYANGQQVTVMIPNGVSINADSAFTLDFLSSAGIKNPSAFRYQLSVHSDAEPTPVDSAIYWISTDSTINTPAVTVDPDSIFVNPQITVSFDLGPSGSLDPAMDIYFAFPAEFTLPTSFSPSLITVNGVPTTMASLNTGNIMRVRSPLTLDAGASDKTVTVVFSSALGITNPSVPATFTLQAYTSLEATPVTSQSFDITAASTTVTQPQVDLIPTFTSSKSRMTIKFNVGAYGKLTHDFSTITITFPQGFHLPGTSFPAGALSVNNAPTKAAATISNQKLTLTVPIEINFGGPVSIELPSSLGIYNPSTVGTYSFIVSTSTEPTEVTSNTITITKASWDDVVSYPNPINKPEMPNPVMTWLYVPDQKATLRLYTLDGRLVKTIVKDDGSDRMVWNLHNEQGSEIASGVYIYIIKGSSGEKRGKVAYKK